jgi:hypothetical protein
MEVELAYSDFWITRYERTSDDPTGWFAKCPTCDIREMKESARKAPLTGNVALLGLGDSELVQF